VAVLTIASVSNVDGANYSACGAEEMVLPLVVAVVIVGNKKDGCSS